MTAAISRKIIINKKYGLFLIIILNNFKINILKIKKYGLKTRCKNYYIILICFNFYL